jgi:hypothetical protein
LNQQGLIMQRALALFVAVLLATPSAGTDGLDPAIVQRVLEIAAAARRLGLGPNDTVNAFTKEMVTAFGPPPTLSLVASEDLDVQLALPLAVLWGHVSDQLRKLEKVTALTTAPAVGIVVTPKRMNAPDIMKVAVLVAGEQIEPLLSGLEPTQMRNAMGATVMKGAGSVLFPESAFSSKDNVRVVVIPRSGMNFEIPITKGQLAVLRGEKMARASTLIGLNEGEVKQKLGQPSDTGPGFLRYIVCDVRLYVYVDASGRVTDVNPKDLDLIALLR